MNNLNKIIENSAFEIKDNLARARKSLRNPEMTIIGAIGELGDNSFEHGATRFDILIDEGTDLTVFEGDDLELLFDNGSRHRFTLTNPGASVAVRDASGKVEYLG